MRQSGQNGHIGERRRRPREGIGSRQRNDTQRPEPGPPKQPRPGESTRRDGKATRTAPDGAAKQRESSEPTAGSAGSRRSHVSQEPIDQLGHFPRRLHRRQMAPSSRNHQPSPQPLCQLGHHPNRRNPIPIPRPHKTRHPDPTGIPVKIRLIITQKSLNHSPDVRPGIILVILLQNPPPPSPIPRLDNKSISHINRGPTGQPEPSDRPRQPSRQPIIELPQTSRKITGHRNRIQQNKTPQPRMPPRMHQRDRSPQRMSHQVTIPQPESVPKLGNGVGVVDEAVRTRHRPRIPVTRQIGHHNVDIGQPGSQLGQPPVIPTKTVQQQRRLRVTVVDSPVPHGGPPQRHRADRFDHCHDVQPIGRTVRTGGMPW